MLGNVKVIPVNVHAHAWSRLTDRLAKISRYKGYIWRLLILDANGNKTTVVTSSGALYSAISATIEVSGTHQ